MLLNKLKHYQPTSSGDAALNEPFSPLWAADTYKARTASSIYNMVQALGNFSRILVVDAVYGNDNVAIPPMQTGQRESVLRPFQNINTAIYAMQQGDVMVVMPGSYEITNFPGLTPKDNTTFLLLNATLNYSGSYSPFFTYPNPTTGVKVIGIGSSSIIKTTTNGWGGIITPYTGPSEIQFHNLTLIAPEQAVALLGAAGSEERIVDFYNCTIYQNDSQVDTAAGGGAGGCSIFMKNCAVKGYTYIHGRTLSREEFNFKALDCNFEAITTNANGKVNILDIGEYYADPTPCTTILERCTFRSENHALEVGVGYGGLGTNKKLLLTDCKFITSKDGWIINNHPSYDFKLLNNYATYAEMGSYPVVNLLSLTGVSFDSLLEF